MTVDAKLHLVIAIFSIGLILWGWRKNNYDFLIMGTLFSLMAALLLSSDFHQPHPNEVVTNYDLPASDKAGEWNIRCYSGGKLIWSGKASQGGIKKDRFSDGAFYFFPKNSISGIEVFGSIGCLESRN